MSWFDDLKKWFWGDLKPDTEPQFEKPKPSETTDEVLEEAVKKTLDKEPEVKKKPKRRYTKTGSEKKPVEKKSTAKKPKKPRTPKKGKK